MLAASQSHLVMILSISCQQPGIPPRGMFKQL
jgi:hypothetical protein